MNDFCSRKGIKREFNNARTPQQNGVAERRNRTLIEAARIMLVDAKLHVTFWTEAINTACYVQNRVLFHEAHLESSTSNTQDDCNADAPKSNGNSNPIATSTNPPVDHMETLVVETLIPTVSSPVLTACLNASPEPSSQFLLFEDTLGVTTNSDESNRVEADLGNMENNISASPTLAFRIHKDHPKSQIIGPVDTPVQTRTKSKKIVEAIKLFLAYASFMGFTIYQMVVKSAFLYGTIDEEVYVMQPLGFQDPEFPTRVYKVEKAMYGLHQAPRAWSDSEQRTHEFIHVYLAFASVYGWIGLRLISLVSKGYVTMKACLKYLLEFLTFEALWSDSEQRAHEFIHVYLAFASVYVWIGYKITESDREHLMLPEMLKDPYVEVALQAPPSPDYIPGPEEPEQAPPSPDYIPGPEHANDEIVTKDQPYAEDASPIAQSPEYVPESDFEAHPEDDDDEDPEEDPVDYPADGGDNGDDEEESSEDDKDDEDDEMDIEVDEEEEEEHPAPADSEDPVDYPADGGDDGDDEEESSEDDEEDDDMDVTDQRLPYHLRRG
uniref:Putative ribonuclease H-like domain-containing protein n=1 Tax=Tanacetum cinerariifolium TaxID=118510 RepID=A0A6L2KQT0_TANCI|nr:putative ribonuclease H-like domain-containing protein [Tanacetum cinerariifolium]